MKYVSVIIPLYNKEPHIKRAILSVLNQTYKCFEIIIVNDGSTDKGPDIVKNMKDSRIRVIKQKNAGVSAARNKGVSISNYELLSFLDADDEWDPMFLETVIEISNKYPEAGMIGTAYSTVKNNERESIKFYNVPKNDGIVENYFKAAIKRTPTCSSAVLMYKSVFEKVNGFPVSLKRGEDTFMWAKIALSYPIVFVNKSLALRHFDSINRASTKDDIIDDFPLLDYINSSNLEIDEKTLYYVKEFTYKKYIARTIQCLRIGCNKKAKYFLEKAKNTKEFKRKYIKLKIISSAPRQVFLSIYRVYKSMFI